MQEILIRVMTRLASFRGEAALVTWAYRIGVNHLVSMRRKLPQEMLTFDGYRQDLLDGLPAPGSTAPAYTAPDSDLLADEIRLICTQALLQCLNRPGRAAYVVGEVLGLLDSAAPCQCGTRVNHAIAKGRIGPGGPVYATHARAANATKAAADLSHLRNVGELLRTHPDYAAPETRTRALLALIRSGRYEGLLPGE
jgi:hypothetical protein